eukprot:Trichotokara_eunicae@DN3631_c0_g1_i2.p1
MDHKTLKTLMKVAFDDLLEALDDTLRTFSGYGILVESVFADKKMRNRVKRLCSDFGTSVGKITLVAPLDVCQKRIRDRNRKRYETSESSESTKANDECRQSEDASRYQNSDGEREKVETRQLIAYVPDEVMEEEFGKLHEGCTLFRRMLAIGSPIISSDSTSTLLFNSSLLQTDQMAEAVTPCALRKLFETFFTRKA